MNRLFNKLLFVYNSKKKIRKEKRTWAGHFFSYLETQAKNDVLQKSII